MLRSFKILSVASSGIQFDGTSATHRHFVTLCLSVYVSTLVYPAWKPLHELRDISDVIHNTAVEIINSKKRALKDGDEAVARQIGQGKDILSILSRGFSSLDCG